MCHAQVNQSSFFATIDHVDPRAENGASGLGKIPAVFSHSQGVGTHDSDAIVIDTLEHLGETGEAVKATLDGLGRQYAVLQAGTELDLFRAHIHWTHFPVFSFGDDQVERIATQVHGSQQAAIR